MTSIDDCDVQPELQTRVQQLTERAKELYANSTNRAFEAGRILGRIQREHLYKVLGFGGFMDFCSAHGFAKTTVHRDIAVAERFSPELHGRLGITRLRLLATRTDAMELLELGVPDGQGGRIPLATIKSRELQARLQSLVSAVDPALDAAVDSLFEGSSLPETPLTEPSDDHEATEQETTPEAPAEVDVALARIPARETRGLDVQEIAVPGIKKRRGVRRNVNERPADNLTLLLPFGNAPSDLATVV